jgi:hypothetical protein
MSPATPPGPRARYKGSMAPIVTAICSVAVRPNFLSYTESLTGPLERVKIEKMSIMWGPIYKVWSSLSFAQTFVEEVMQQVANKMKVQWCVDLESTSDEQITAWSQSHAKQFRAMSRHLGQAIAARKGWALNIVKAPVDAGDDDDGEQEGEEKGEEEVPKETDEVCDEVDDNRADEDM